MLPHNFRLPSSEFHTRGYRTQKTPYFSLKVKSNNLPNDRIGVIINVAAVKGAARRNFWKRQVKAILSGRSGKGIDLLLIFFKKADVLTKAEFKKELQQARRELLETVSRS